jgi:hypothetical protein
MRGQLRGFDRFNHWGARRLVNHERPLCARPCTRKGRGINSSSRLRVEDLSKWDESTGSEFPAIQNPSYQGQLDTSEQQIALDWIWKRIGSLPSGSRNQIEWLSGPWLIEGTISSTNRTDASPRHRLLSACPTASGARLATGCRQIHLAIAPASIGLEEVACSGCFEPMHQQEGFDSGPSQIRTTPQWLGREGIR